MESLKGFCEAVPGEAVRREVPCSLAEFKLMSGWWLPGKRFERCGTFKIQAGMCRTESSHKSWNHQQKISSWLYKEGEAAAAPSCRRSQRRMPRMALSIVPSCYVSMPAADADDFAPIWSKYPVKVVGLCSVEAYIRALLIFDQHPSASLFHPI